MDRKLRGTLIRPFELATRPRGDYLNLLQTIFRMMKYSWLFLIMSILVDGQGEEEM